MISHIELDSFLLKSGRTKYSWVALFSRSNQKIIRSQRVERDFIHNDENMINHDSWMKNGSIMVRFVLDVDNYINNADGHWNIKLCIVTTYSTRSIEK